MHVKLEPGTSARIAGLEMRSVGLEKELAKRRSGHGKALNVASSVSSLVTSLVVDNC